MPAIDELAQHVENVEVAAGQEVFHQGDHGDRFYVIEDGEAEVIGDDRLIRTLDSGDGFEEIALLHDALRTATVRARTPLWLYTLDRHDFFPQSPATSRASARRTLWCSTGSAPSTPRTEPTGWTQRST